MTSNRQSIFCAAPLALCVALGFALTPVSGKPPATRPAPATSAVQGSGKLTVAIVDFEVAVPGNADFAKQLSSVVVGTMQGSPGFSLIDREDLNRSLREQELALTGLVSNADAVKVGKLVGARIIVTGKAFTLGDQFFITAKLIGTETSLVEGVLVKSKVGDDPAALALQFAERLTARIREVGPRLTADDDIVKDPMPALKARLATLALPVVAVVITEHVIAKPELRADPAAETEIKLLLTQAGITVKDVAANRLTDWLKDIDKTKGAQWPQELANVDIIITGDGSSDTAVKIGGLFSSSAHVEMNVIQRKDGRIVIADKETTRAVDISENIASKKALEKAGHALGLKVLDYLSANLPPEKPH